MYSSIALLSVECVQVGEREGSKMEANQVGDCDDEDDNEDNGLVGWLVGDSDGGREGRKQQQRRLKPE